MNDAYHSPGPHREKMNASFEYTDDGYSPKQTDSPLYKIRVLGGGYRNRKLNQSCLEPSSKN